MSNSKRIIKVKFKNELGTELEKIFGTSELDILLEETDTLYKTLSRASNIEDWNLMGADETSFENKEGQSLEQRIPMTGDWSDIKFKCEIDIIRLVSIFMSAAKKEEFKDLGPSSQVVKNYIISEYNNSSPLGVSDFELMGLKTILEFRYSGDFAAAHEEMLGRLTDESSWTMLRNSNTTVSVIYQLLK